MRAPIVDRLIGHVSMTDTGCWLWTLGTRDGYGSVNYLGRVQFAHRVAYETFIGPVPVGFQLDHLCRNRACINPTHLEPVTPRENILRSPIAIASLNAQKTHCQHGHPFDAANTLIMTSGSRLCRTCRAVKRRAWQAAHSDYFRRYLQQYRLRKRTQVLQKEAT